jgi:hypothetical protein
MEHFDILNPPRGIFHEALQEMPSFAGHIRLHVRSGG